MKKFISMVMAAAMVVSLVPATAFAASATVTGKVVEASEITIDEAKATTPGLAISGPELQLTVGEVNAKVNGTDTFDVTLKFNGANVTALGEVNVYRIDPTTGKYTEIEGDFVSGTPDVDRDKDTIDFTLTEIEGVDGWDIAKGDMITIALDSTFQKAKLGSATVEVKGELGAVEAMVYASIVGKGIKAELDDDCVNVAPEEYATIENIVVKPTAGADFEAVGLKNADEDVITLKLNKGFEFVYNGEGKIDGYAISEDDYIDNDEIELAVSATMEGKSKLTFSDLTVEATTAKAGDVAVITVKATGLDSVKVADVAKVVDFKVVMELTDADEDVPVIYSGVNDENVGITDDSDHKALSVTIKETFPGAWSNHKDWTLSLPEGVYVTAVEAVDETVGGTWADIEADFVNAYKNGDHVYFEFDKYTFDETHDLDDDVPREAHEFTFVLTLVADPGFVGDVVLTLEGAAVDTQEVTIAKFVSPLTVKAEQNDVIIDYRYTEVPTAIVVEEAEAGLWDKDLVISFTVENMDLIVFEEDTATFTVNEGSDMEVEEVEIGTTLAFIVEETSDEEAAVVTIDGIELFMQRNIPAGPYALNMFYGVDFEEDEDGYGWTGIYNGEILLGQVATVTETGTVAACTHKDCDNVGDVCDYSTEVHESWINVVTAGRDQDDASFTTEVVVPVGESYIVAGETQIALDVPAYINADGYTMLPVRAVATALGINNEAVQWDQATKTVIIMYGQRIITMTAGSSVVYVSGTAIPAKSAVEIVDGRAFLGLRDLATTLGVAKIAWDPATNVATLNPKA